MPLYTATTEQNFVSDATKATVAAEITHIHAAVMKVPKNFVGVVFLFYPKHSGYMRWSWLFGQNFGRP
jgi:phenylpyruvate tautomerase PptA (4-oxalocrotonate tautomerase family)